MYGYLHTYILLQEEHRYGGMINDDTINIIQNVTIRYMDDDRYLHLYVTQVSSSRKTVYLLTIVLEKERRRLKIICIPSILFLINSSVDASIFF